jgi:hypothetical protein
VAAGQGGSRSTSRSRGSVSSRPHGRLLLRRSYQKKARRRRLRAALGRGTAGLGREIKGGRFGMEKTERESWERWPPARHLAVSSRLGLALHGEGEEQQSHIALG